MDSSNPWVVGWLLGGGVVAIAASVLLTIIGLARRIVRQAGEIEAAIDDARDNTTVLFDVTTTNLALDRTARGLRDLRGGE